MNEEQLEELRRRVALRKNAAEAAELKAELRGKNLPIEPGLIYLSVKTVAEEAGVSRDTVVSAVRRGDMRGRQISGGKVGHMWAIHPDDAAAFIARYKGERDIRVK